MSAEDLPDEPWIAKPLQAIKGRGAVSNLPGRFETQRIDAVDDSCASADSLPVQSVVRARDATLCTRRSQAG